MNLKNNRRKTIILLSPKRSGSTLVQNIFSNNKFVKLCHQNQFTKVVECQFWSLSYLFLNKKISYKYLRQKFLKQTSFDIKKIYKENIRDKSDIFKIWNIILDKFGPIIFDKSPQYLSDFKIIELIIDYAKSGNQVNFLSIIRDPRDVLMSQYLLWGGKIIEREEEIITKFENLNRLNKRVNLYIFKYENLVKKSKIEIVKLFNFCNLEYSQITQINFNEKSVNLHKNYFSNKIKYSNSTNFQKIIEYYE